jgi:hypothetical protein
MFAGVNKNFISAAVEGTLMMARDYVDFDGLQTAAVDNRADILPTDHDV